MRPALLALALLAAPCAARAQVFEPVKEGTPPSPLEAEPAPRGDGRVHLDATAGVGVGFSLLGVRLGARYGRFALSASTGAWWAAGVPNGALSAQVFWRPDGSGPFLSANAMGTRERTGVGALLSLLVGWRWRWHGAFGELGFGEGAARLWECVDWNQDVCTAHGYWWEPLPVAIEFPAEVSLAVGWEL